MFWSYVLLFSFFGASTTTALSPEKFELERISYAFSKIDSIFGQSIIQVQKLNKQDHVISEHISNLYYFLSKPHKYNKILALLEKKKKLKPEGKLLLEKNRPSSFIKAVRLLWEHEQLNQSEANALIEETAPMTSEEIIRLAENGAALTKSRYLIKLRTGQNYGDAIKLNDDAEAALRMAIQKEKACENLPEASLLELLETPCRTHILKAFADTGHHKAEDITDAYLLQEMRKYFSFC